MSLTTTDLQAIRGIVKEEVNASLDEAMIQVAAGFEEVHLKLADHDTKFANIDVRFDILEAKLEETNDTVKRIELVQRTEIGRTEYHGREIKRILTKLHISPLAK